MLMKKASCLAADIMRHGRKVEAEMMPLTDSSTFGSTWSEQGKEETSSSTEAVLPSEKKRSRREAVLEQQQRQRRSRRSPSRSSQERVLDDSEHSATRVRGASPKPRRQQWSAMFFVHMSLVVVSLAVAATIALVFTLRDNEVQSLDVAGLSDDDGSDVAVAVGKNATDPGAIQFRGALVTERGPPASREADAASVGGGRVKLGPSSIRNIEGPRPSTPERRSSADPSAVLVLQDGTFGNARVDVPPLMPPPGPASELDVERRRRYSAPRDGVTTPGTVEVADGSASSPSGRDKDKTAHAKPGRGTQAKEPQGGRQESRNSGASERLKICRWFLA
ncbi:hypothetical protein MTO96_040185 [Rhipicephalus appendiculatus]